MNAVVNDNAVIGESAIVAAMAFVKAGMVVPPRTLVAGMPARIVRELTDQELAWKEGGTKSYQELTRRCLATMEATSPLAAPEADRPRIVLGDAAAARLQGAPALTAAMQGIRSPPPARRAADRTPRRNRCRGAR